MASPDDILTTPPRLSALAWPTADNRWSWSTGSEDRLTAVLVVLLAIAWLLEGARSLLGLPHGVVGVADVAQMAVCIWLLGRMARSCRRGLVLLIELYAVWLFTAAIYSGAPAASLFTGLKDALVLPLLAIGLAALGPTETRARTLIAALLVLCSFEFVLTLFQFVAVPRARQDADLVVGSFGSSANAVLGVVTLLTACVGLAGYVTGAYRNRRALGLTALLSLIAAWSGVKLAPLLLPVVALSIGIPALLLRRTSRGRVIRALLASLAASGLVFALYAVFLPASLTALTSGLGSYLANGSINSTVPVQSSARFGRFLAAGYANAGVMRTQTVTGASALRIYNASSGDYTADFLRSAQPSLPLGGEPLRVRRGAAYRFRFRVEDVVNQPQTVQAQIEWRTRHLKLLHVSVGPQVSLFGLPDRFHRLTVGGIAPDAAAYAVPKVALTGSPRVGAAIDLVPARFASVSQIGRLGSLVVADDVNSSVLLRRTMFGPALVVQSLEPRDYTARLPQVDGQSPYVSPGGSYVFAAKLYAPRVDEWARLEIAWEGSGRGVVGTTILPLTRLVRATAPRVLVLRGQAPSGASSALLKIGVVRSRQPSALYVFAATFGTNVSLGALGPSIPGQTFTGSSATGSVPAQTSTGGQATGSGPAQAPTSPSVSASGLLQLPTLSNTWPQAQTTSVPSVPVSGLLRLPRLTKAWAPVAQTSPPPGPPENPADEPLLPGHLTLLHMALTGVSGSLGNAILGHGLGSATVAASLGGVLPQDLPPYAAAASYSDAGTILYERGWLGIAVVVIIAAGLMTAGIFEFRRRPSGQWSAAFSLAIPAAVLVMAVYGLIGTQLQNRSTALTFWLIVGLGLPATVPWRRPVSRTPGRGSQGVPPSGHVGAVGWAVSSAGRLRGDAILAHSTAKLRSVGVVGVLVAIFAVLRIIAVAHSPLSYSDTGTYLALNFLGHAERLWTVPLVWNIFTSNDGREAVQVLLGIVSWSLLAVSLGQAIDGVWTRRLGVAAVLMLGLVPEVAGWDRILLSESISTSLLVLLIGLLIRVSLRPSGRLIASCLGVLTLWMFTRQLNVLIFLMTLPLVIPFTLWRGGRHRTWIVAALLFIGVWGGWAIEGPNSGSSGVWEWNAVQIIEEDVAPNPAALQFFYDHGLPRSHALLVSEGTAFTGSNSPVFKDHRVMQWIANDYQSTYFAYLLRHLRHALEEPLVKFFPAVSIVPGLAVTRTVLPAAVTQRYWNPNILVWLIAALGLAASVYLRRGRIKGWPVLLLLGITAVGGSILTFNTTGYSLTYSPGDFARIFLPLSVTVRICVILTIFLSIDALLRVRWVSEAGGRAGAGLDAGHRSVTSVSGEGA